MYEHFCPYCMREVERETEVCPDCGSRLAVDTPSHHLPVGTVLKGGNGHLFLFGIVKGEGGFGLTYIGKELNSGRLVAIKEYFPSRCQPQRLPDGSIRPQERFEEIYAHGMQSFLSEASMLRAVANLPSIVYVMDYFEANRTAYMVMEYLNGSTLQHVMQKQERIPADTLISKFLPLMRDLESLHKAGVLHRDIAPDNIMWMPDGSLKLLDFGCARSLEDGRSMTVVLKPGFAPIEQYQTRGQGPYTDLYALCATIYYCITGKIPPASPERLTTTFDNQPDSLIPPSALGVSLSPEQEQILMWGLSLQPSVRPQNMETLAARLEKASASQAEMAKVQNAGSQNIDSQNTAYQNEMINDSYPIDGSAASDNHGKNILSIAIAVVGAAIAAIIILLCIL
ncbi:MAG: serine/threonine protein kinase [Roseburia sp.]|nr:serine/threonine protein kinase [Roseburia sp.]